MAEQDVIQPEDLTQQTLIAYPVEAKRLDIIANFMTPAEVSFKNIRTTELTTMLIQLYAATRSSSQDTAYIQGFASLLDGIVKPV